MNKTIIDSHILLWLLYEPEKIGKEAAKLIQASDDVFVSLVSILELALKFKKGKLGASPSYLLKNIKRTGLEILGIKEMHIVNMVEINFRIKDPFDALLMAQAKSEEAFLLTVDSLILKTKPDYTIDARL